jgi:plasmid stabilization system protein ParE
MTSAEGSALGELRVRATSRFAQDLEDSASYYLERAGEQAARRFLDEYDKFCTLVSAFPGYGSLVGDTDLRWRKVGVFIAVYREDADGGEVVLLRLYYLSSNWRKHALGISRDADE